MKKTMVSIEDKYGSGTYGVDPEANISDSYYHAIRLEKYASELRSELQNCLRIFERDGTPDPAGRNERIRKMLKKGRY